MAATTRMMKCFIPYVCLLCITADRTETPSVDSEKAVQHPSSFLEDEGTTMRGREVVYDTQEKATACGPIEVKEWSFRQMKHVTETKQTRCWKKVDYTTSWKTNSCIWRTEWRCSVKKPRYFGREDAHSQERCDGRQRMVKERC
eukprot:TRINITY_DN88777_c0_g1_i1.p2 TRINITY_DN88777_c0_g1~~TRINITY_DN88777_c0_g1_i1.p2  ORF type:complete len:162 (-),score=11.97 TRINITY_DN88777_c0_g1_i1:241-672(-)